MGFLIYDFTCPNCQSTEEHLVQPHEKDAICCSHCTDATGTPIPMARQAPAGHEFRAIIPTYPGSKRRKAGYQHKFVNRPATKTQVGYGGGVSQGEPH